MMSEGVKMTGITELALNTYIKQLPSEFYSS